MFPCSIAMRNGPPPLGRRGRRRGGRRNTEEESDAVGRSARPLAVDVALCWKGRVGSGEGLRLSGGEVTLRAGPRAAVCAVERVEASHVTVGEFEVEQLGVGVDALLVAGRGDDDGLVLD